MEHNPISSWICTGSPSKACRVPLLQHLSFEMLVFATFRAFSACNCLYAKEEQREKLGPLVNEEWKKINDNSEITTTDLTLGICPSSSLQGQSPALQQQHKSRKQSSSSAATGVSSLEIKLFIVPFL